MQVVKIEEKAADSNLRFEKAVVKIFDKGHKKQLGLLKSCKDKGHKKHRTQKARDTRRDTHRKGYHKMRLIVSHHPARVKE